MTARTTPPGTAGGTAPIPVVPTPRLRLVDEYALFPHVSSTVWLSPTATVLGVDPAPPDAPAPVILYVQRATGADAAASAHEFMVAASWTTVDTAGWDYVGSVRHDGIGWHVYRKATL